MQLVIKYEKKGIRTGQLEGKKNIFRVKRTLLLIKNEWNQILKSSQISFLDAKCSYLTNAMKEIFNSECIDDQAQI